MRHQRVPELASQETASGLQNGCRMFAHCTEPAPSFTPHPIGGMMSAMAALASPQKITFAEMRESGARGLLVYCADYR